MEKKRLTELVTSSGCNAKLPPGDLHKVLSSLPVIPDRRILGGYETADDAFVYDLGDGRALLETVDFFPPMVDDPYIFGQIAAANAISDIYAMGGTPAVAMSVMCFPSCLELSVMQGIMLGAVDKGKEAGIVIAGGHTISDREPKFGLAVTGFCPIDKVWANKGARPGDALVLTKKLGVGILMTALKGGMIAQEEAEEALLQMRRLNRKAMEAGQGLSVHAATDVTGFSLLGHTAEMAEASGVTASIRLSAVPVLDGALENARFGLLPEGRYTNEDYIGEKVLFDEAVKLEQRDVLFSPETSGGLLLSLPRRDAEEYLSRIGGNAWIIGEISEKGSYPVVVQTP